MAPGVFLKDLWELFSRSPRGSFYMTHKHSPRAVTLLLISRLLVQVFFFSRDPARDAAPPPTAPYKHERARGSYEHERAQGSCVEIVSHLSPANPHKTKRKWYSKFVTRASGV